jgi:dTDP-glucose 4,6-dehydratase
MPSGARFVHRVDLEVYGDPLEHPQKETYWGNVNPIGPRGVYDEAKRFSEAMTPRLSPAITASTPKIVRIFNTVRDRACACATARRGSGIHVAGAQNET